MGRVERTPDAVRDLDDIFDYVARQAQRPEAAAKLMRDIDAKFRQYASQPLMGSLDEQLGDDLRFFSHKRYVVVYRPLGDGIEILRVLDGARDWRRLFGP